MRTDIHCVRCGEVGRPAPVCRACAEETSPRVPFAQRMLFTLIWAFILIGLGYCLRGHLDRSPRTLDSTTRNL